tara:strand:+ start:1371 stop:1583 length:213 start_codon:yes stop_codon:yes gene_type:complete
MSTTNKHINITREGLARRTAREYVAGLLLDGSWHADAFEISELTKPERAIARAEVEQIGIEILQRYKCDL